MTKLLVITTGGSIWSGRWWDLDEELCLEISNSGITVMAHVKAEGPLFSDTFWRVLPEMQQGDLILLASWGEADVVLQGWFLGDGGTYGPPVEVLMN